MMQYSRYHEGLTYKSLSSDYGTAAYYANKVEYCRSCLTRSHCASICKLLSHVTRNVIINETHISLASLFPWKSYRSSPRSPRRSRNYTISSFCPENRSPKDSGWTISITHCPRKSSHWARRKNTLNANVRYQNRGSSSTSIGNVHATETLTVENM